MEQAAERLAAAAALRKHQALQADVESKRAALQRDLAAAAEQLKAQEASAAVEREAACAAQAVLCTQRDTAEARLLGLPARLIDRHACA